MVPLFSFGQFKYSSEFPVNFKIDNVTLGIVEDIVNVSGGTPDGKWAIKMTWKFTNLYKTTGSGEYTALGWAQDGENFLETSVRGVWKRNGKVFEVKHFENGQKFLSISEKSNENLTKKVAGYLILPM